MEIAEAQREVRAAYSGGLFGQLISAVLWIGSAALGTWRSPRAAIWVLVAGGFLIFPAVTVLLRLLGRSASLPRGNPLHYLGMQLAFVLPLSMPLVAPVTAFRVHWFFPAMMILLGAHYLPFTFLYGMRSFIALSALLVGAGVVIALWFPGSFAFGGWVAGALLLVFAFVGWAEANRDNSSSGGGASEAGAA
jgi:hypothetical protein